MALVQQKVEKVQNPDGLICKRSTLACVEDATTSSVESFPKKSGAKKSSQGWGLQGELNVDAFPL
ncbi:hypothetical protein OS493_009901 [Desmophyllum pertusum]|uniref:Uncharacterized protein n=1 Tax=Desmophyllum pertusum TaxID=174260 RepID=A0A9W9YHC5_9CNID|nr:hypothetical protein OS493_009901 [Desmophyllum pertusum]